MFEIEAKDSFNCKNVYYKRETDKRSYIDGFKDGAEFGYNKGEEEIKKLKELVSDCLFYCDHIDPYYNECLSEDNIFERAAKLGID